jgi:hypothetical protein
MSSDVNDAKIRSLNKGLMFKVLLNNVLFICYITYEYEQTH